MKYLELMFRATQESSGLIECELTTASTLSGEIILAKKMIDAYLDSQIVRAVLEESKEDKQCD